MYHLRRKCNTKKYFLEPQIRAKRPKTKCSVSEAPWEAARSGGACAPVYVLQLSGPIPGYLFYVPRQDE